MSTSYYALFHLLVADAVGLMLPGAVRAGLRNCLSRAFDHSTMYKAARQFASGGVSPALALGLNGQSPQIQLARVAAAFMDLQQHRHGADYDMSRVFNRPEVLSITLATESAFADWDGVRKSIQADTFLVGLLALDKVRGNDPVGSRQRANPNASASNS